MTTLGPLEVPLSSELPRLEQLWADNISANAFFASPAGENAVAMAVEEDARGLGGAGSASRASHDDFDASTTQHQHGGASALSVRGALSRFSHANGSVVGHNGGTIYEAGSSKRLHLSLTDTPGLDFGARDDFELERAVRRLVRQIEDRYLASLAEEGKVQRRSRQHADEHFHVVLYFIDPLRVVETEAPASAARTKMLRNSGQNWPTQHTRSKSLGGSSAAAEARAAMRAEPFPTSQSAQADLSQLAKSPRRRTSSAHGPVQKRAAEDTDIFNMVSLNGRPSERQRAATAAGHGDVDLDEAVSDSEAEDRAGIFGMNGHSHTMMQQEDSASSELRLRISAQEQKIIKRLAALANVVPVLSKADLLTEQRCLEVKAAVRRSFKEMGLPVGPYLDADEELLPQNVEEDIETLESPDFRLTHDAPLRRVASTFSDVSDVDPEGAIDGVKRIKLRPRRSFSKSSADRPSKESLAALKAPTIEKTEPLFGDKFKARMQQSEARPLPRPRTPKEKSNQWPLTLIMPEPTQPAVPPHSAIPRNGAAVPPVPAIPAQHLAHTRDNSSASDHSLVSAISDSLGARGLYQPILPTSAADMAKRFQRRYRWGAIDTLNPEHCDFTTLRAALLVDSVETMRTATNAKYEAFRADKLEARKQPLSRA